MHYHPTFALLLIVAWIGTTSSVIAAEGELPLFKITTKRPADKIEVMASADTTVISVRSPGGIGQAVIERVEEKWPQKTVVRLHLTGLESFQVSNGKSMLSVSVSSHADRRRIRVWKDDMEASPLESKDQLWIDVRILDENSKPTENLPLKNGYFELQMPKAFFEENPRSITLHWIDFYRN